MNSLLLNRQIGSITPQVLTVAQNEYLVSGIQHAQHVQFWLKRPGETSHAAGARVTTHASRNLAHNAGVNSIDIDRFEGRYLLSGGADSSVAIWDLETQHQDNDNLIHTPLAQKPRTSTRENLSINHISFYPYDSLAFLTSGFDKTLKLFSSETLDVSATFDLNANIYSHATSTIASHLLVACATHHPAVRLVDLNSGSTTHSLAGHAGSVLTVAWHPRSEHILASGATDGSLRLWDIRRSANSLGVLDLDDTIGLVGHDGQGTSARRRERGCAHTAAVNGILWTADGRHLISTGHDERMRVWDAVTGANTLANFGPALKNTTNTVLLPLLTPPGLLPSGNQQTLYFPNPKEILNYEVHSGTLLRRLRIPSLPVSQQQQGAEGGIRNLNQRTTSLCWRAHEVEFYSGHADGSIRCWSSRTADGDAGEDDEVGMDDDEMGRETAERKRKRDELDQIVRDLTSKKVTFS